MSSLISVSEVVGYHLPSGSKEEGGLEASRKPSLQVPLLLRGCVMHEKLHRLEVVPLYLHVGHPAVPLSGAQAAVSKEILDGHNVRVGIEQLRGHRVPELMTASPEPSFVGIILHSLLDPADGDRRPPVRTFLHQEEPFHLGGRSGLQILDEGLEGIRADVHHAVFATLAVLNQDTATAKVKRPEGQVGDLLYP